MVYHVAFSLTVCPSCSALANNTQYPLVTTDIYKRAWASLAVAEQYGTRTDHVTRQYGVSELPAARNFPGSRNRFATLFPQDPMHDLGEGVAAWFLLEFFHAYFHYDPTGEVTFLSAYSDLRSKVRGFDLPLLDQHSFERVRRRQTLMLSGMSRYIYVYDCIY